MNEFFLFILFFFRNFLFSLSARPKHICLLKVASGVLKTLDVTVQVWDITLSHYLKIFASWPSLIHSGFVCIRSHYIRISCQFGVLNTVCNELRWHNFISHIYDMLNVLLHNYAYMYIDVFCFCFLFSFNSVFFAV